MGLAAGTRVGAYEIVGSLGAGGMGEVYRARDPRLGREVAVKVLAEGAECEADRLERFELEGRAAAAITHPNILTIHDLGVWEGRPFLVTELVPGESVRERLGRGPLPAAEAVALALQLVRGIGAAHAAGIVHRDLKAENLVVTPSGTLKILDFGVAKLRPDGTDPSAPTLAATVHGMVLGTPASMAPEQVRGEPVDGRADLFAVGVVLYEMLTGLQPFARPTAAATIGAVLHEAPPPLGERAPGVPQALERLVRHCLAKDPAERFQSARDLAFALESVAAELDTPGRGSAAHGSSEAASIAVLPFVDLSPTRDQEYFCDGLAEELLNALSRVAGLRVAARSSSFQFRGAGVDARSAGQRLGVAMVVEGSVRKAGDALRVTVRLIDVSDGYQRWSDRFDRKLEDVFAIQDEVAECVVRCLGDHLGMPLQPPPEVRPETRIDTYELYLRGRHLLNHFRLTAMGEAIELFEQALEIDPEYAPAWAGIAEAHAWIFHWWGGNETNLREANRASARAAELRPELATVRTARGLALSLDRQYEEAEAEFEAATELDPKLFEAWYYWARTCFAAGRIERSAELFRRATEARPEDFQAPILLGQSLRMLGREEEAEAFTREGVRRAERRLELDPADSRALALGATALGDIGDSERAVRWMEKALGLYPDEGDSVMNGICLFAKLGDLDRALDLLETAIRKGLGNRDWIEHDPDYDPLRDHPRYQALLAMLP